jgi:hypothetical protein
MPREIDEGTHIGEALHRYAADDLSSPALTRRGLPFNDGISAVAVRCKQRHLRSEQPNPGSNLPREAPLCLTQGGAFPLARSALLALRRFAHFPVTPTLRRQRTIP